jgi:hypothetical protein
LHLISKLRPAYAAKLFLNFFRACARVFFSPYLSHGTLFRGPALRQGADRLACPENIGDDHDGGRRALDAGVASWWCAYGMLWQPVPPCPFRPQAPGLGGQAQWDYFASTMWVACSVAIVSATQHPRLGKSMPANIASRVPSSRRDCEVKLVDQPRP